MKKMILVSTMVLSLGVFAGCSSEKSNSTKASSTSASQSSTVASSSQTTSSSSANAGEYKVSLSEAIDTYKETYPDTDIVSIGLDSSLGKTYYSIDGVDDNKEYEIKVNTETKEVKKDREEALDNDEKNGVKRKENKLNLEGMKDMTEIFDIAIKEAGAGQIEDWEIKEDMGVTYWEVSVKDGITKEYEYKINAQTGEVLESDVD